MRPLPDLSTQTALRRRAPFFVRLAGCCRLHPAGRVRVRVRGSTSTEQFGRESVDHMAKIGAFYVRSGWRIGAPRLLVLQCACRVGVRAWPPFLGALRFLCASRGRPSDTSLPAPVATAGAAWAVGGAPRSLWSGGRPVGLVFSAPVSVHGPWPRPSSVLRKPYAAGGSIIAMQHETKRQSSFTD